MEKVQILIDWVPDNYGASLLNERIACAATGNTLEEVKKNIVEALQFHIDGLKEDGEPIPEELQRDWEPAFQLSTRALLKYTGGYITQKALSQETGIAEQQLSHYANGLRHPRPAMHQRIVNGVQAICKQLSLVLYDTGFEDGMEKGKAEERIAVAKNMLAMRYPIESIVQITGLTPEEITALQ